jgi:phage baseplate assembly protein W
MTDRIDTLTTRKTTQKDPVFSDFYNNFNVHPQNKRLALYTDEQAVRRSMRNILSTNTKERLFNPEFGGGLRRFLFEDISVMTADLMKDAIKDSIQKYEPRARIVDVLVVSNEFAHSYDVSVYYEVINNTNPQTLQLTLYRVR